MYPQRWRDHFSLAAALESLKSVDGATELSLNSSFIRTTITDEQRREFGQLAEDTIGRIESAHFLPHSGVRFPQNPCSNCPYVGLCLGNPLMAETRLVRRPGAENLGWLDELAY